MHEYFLNIHMSAYDVEQVFYGSGIQNLIITAENGLRVQLAIRHLVPFITRNGIRGRFRLRTDAKHAFVSLEKIA